MNHTFEANVTQIWGTVGSSWLTQLPNIIAILTQQWQLDELRPAENLSYHYILLGYQNAKPIALKIGCDSAAFNNEKQALKIYNGNGCIQLLDSNAEYNALLLERAMPGSSLKQLFPLQDTVAVTETVNIMQQLHAIAIPPDINIPLIDDWLALLNNPHPALAHNAHIHQAQTLARHLLDTQTKKVLLHGDLHYDNILLCDTGWKAIDPKGIIGEQAYEIGACIRNPCPELLEQPNPGTITKQRLALFAQLLHMDQQRLWQWSYVQAVLAGCWAMQDGQTNPDMALAEAIILNSL